MKQVFKKILLSLKLLDSLRYLQSLFSKISLSNLQKEIAYRKNGLPDRYPAPPSKLIFLIIRSVWSFEYWHSGLAIINDLQSHFERLNVNSKQFKRILDFGCGCGRLTRQLTRFKNAEVYGTDYNERLIAWSSKYLTNSHYACNNLKPPLAYQTEYFDLVVARSVFTHLDYQLQFDWIDELYRIITPGGYLYFTTHSELSTHSLGEHLIHRFKEEGFVSQNSDLQGDNKCAVYQSKDWVYTNLAKKFSAVEYIPGRLEEHLGQDIYIFQKPK